MPRKIQEESDPTHFSVKKARLSISVLIDMMGDEGRARDAYDQGPQEDQPTSPPHWAMPLLSTPTSPADRHTQAGSTFSSTGVAPLPTARIALATSSGLSARVSPPTARMAPTIGATSMVNLKLSAPSTLPATWSQAPTTAPLPPPGCEMMDAAGPERDANEHGPHHHQPTHPQCWR